MSETALPEVEQRLHRLVARDVARRVRMSSVQHQTEFAFLHVLVRDVAYAQIPRAGRMRKHRAAAEWVEQLAGDRVTDHAELLAHHYVCALDLARLVGAHAETEELATRARRFLELAGDRAYALDVEQAETYYRRALDLTPPSDESRGRVLARLSEVVQLGGRLAEAERLSETAIDAFRSHGNLPGAGEAMVTLATASWRQGKTRRSSELLAQAVELLERQTHGPELAAAYSRMAMTDFTAGKPAEGLRWAEKALALARRLRLEAVRARALQFRGMARFELGDLGGLEDLREALQLSLSGGFGFETGTSYSNLADLVWVVDGPVAGLELKETALAFTEQRGIIHHSMFVKVEMLRLLFDLGEWDALLGHAEDVLAWDRGDEPSQLSIGALPMKARVLLWRGETAEASGLELDYLPLSREIGDPQMLVPALATAAAARLARGDTAAALALVEELEAVTYRGTLTERVRELPAAARIRAAAKAAPAGLALLPADDEVFFARGRHSVASARAALTEATGELEEALNLYSTAAEGWRTFGCVPERAQALLGQGRCLLGLGRRAEAAPLAREAHELATSLGALPLIAEAGRIGLRAPRE